MGRRKGKEPKPTPRGRAIWRLRQEMNWSAERLGEASCLSEGVINNLENGWRKEPTQEEAEEMIAPTGLPAAAIDMSLAFGRWVRAAAAPPEPLPPEEEDDRRCLVGAGLIGLHVARIVYPLLVRRKREERIARDRQRAAENCDHLRRLPTVEARRERIQNAEDYQTWAMVEVLASESERAAADTPAKAFEWAELALFTVPFVPGPENRRKRLEGWATFALANAHRVDNDLHASDRAFQRAWVSWEAGKDDDFLPLDEGWPLDLEASLRREQRRFPEALDFHKRALKLSPEEGRGRILLNKAFTLEQMGDPEAAIEAMEQARPYVEKAGKRRDIFALRCNLSVALRKLGRWAEAEELVPAVRDVVGNDELDLIRTLWNESLIDAGLGRIAKATAALEQVFDQLVALGLPYDAALAGLDLAAVHLEQGHTREVMFLAGRMEAVFRTFNIEREALAALCVFFEAARREEATVELARRTAEAIEKAPREAPPKGGRGGKA
jgi:tetratricopeptide (TPR) repeat protein